MAFVVDTTVLSEFRKVQARVHTTVRQSRVVGMQVLRYPTRPGADDGHTSLGPPRAASIQ